MDILKQQKTKELALFVDTSIKIWMFTCRYIFPYFAIFAECIVTLGK